MSDETFDPGEKEGLHGRLYQIEARLDRLEAAIRAAADCLTATKPGEASPFALSPDNIRRRLDADAGEGRARNEAEYRERSARLDDPRARMMTKEEAAAALGLASAPTPPPAAPEVPEYELPESGLTEALSALRSEGWHNTADNLLAWYRALPPAEVAEAVGLSDDEASDYFHRGWAACARTLPPALDPEAVEVLRESADHLDQAWRLGGCDRWTYERLAARLRALADKAGGAP